MSYLRTHFGRVSDAFFADASDEKRRNSAVFGRIGRIRTYFARYEPSRTHMREIGKTCPHPSDASAIVCFQRFRRKQSVRRDSAQ